MSSSGTAFNAAMKAYQTAVDDFGPWLSKPAVAATVAESEAEAEPEAEAIPPPHLMREGDDLSDPNAWRTVNELVAKLLNPPINLATNHKWGPSSIRITMKWVMTALGEGHFYMNSEMGRPVLRDNSKVKTHGLQAGLPESYYNWLVGGDKRERWASQEHEFFVSRSSFLAARNAPRQARY